MSEIAFYRNKSAIQTSFIAPVMKAGKQGRMYCERLGVLMLSGANGDNKVYDWETKVTFGLSIADVPNILNEWNLYKYNRLVHACTQSKELAPIFKVECVHDPNKGKDAEGSVIKILTILNSKANDKGQPTYFLIVATNQGKRVYVSMSEGEVEMFINLITTLMPKFVGWD